jgi:hypothetical protein
MWVAALVVALPAWAAAVTPPALSALEDLYNATNGPWWFSPSAGSAWFSGPDPCSWDGVVCNASQSLDPMYAGVCTAHPFHLWHGVVMCVFF